MWLIFTFFNFLFYRIMSAAMFDDPLTIWACALTAIVVTLIVSFGGALGVIWASTDEKGEPIQPYPLETITVFVGLPAACCLIAYLIALGFSDRLYRDISRWSSYEEFYEQDLVWFCVMISIPVLVQLFIIFREFRK